MRERDRMRATLCCLGLIGVLVIALAGCAVEEGTTKTLVTPVTGGSGTITTGGTEAHTAPSSGCVQAITKISDNVSFDQFCGPAKAQTIINGQKVNWSNGNCIKGSTGFSLDIGRAVLSGNNAGQQYIKDYDFFNISTGSKIDGTYTNNAVIDFDYRGQGYVIVPVTLTLSGGIRQGTFTGTDRDSGASVSGSFIC